MRGDLGELPRRIPAAEHRIAVAIKLLERGLAPGVALGAAEQALERAGLLISREY